MKGFRWLDCAGIQLHIKETKEMHKEDIVLLEFQRLVSLSFEPSSL